MSIKCVFFDLDGTLADTSVDMCNALNTVLVNNKFKTVDCIKLKTHIFQTQSILGPTHPYYLSNDDLKLKL